MSEQMPEITDEDARAHAEELLQMLTTRSNEERQFTELLNAAYRQRAEEGNQP